MDQRGRTRPTLEAVAAHAGVSRATVSRVVNGGVGVRESLRRRVERSIEELGYVPNQAARSLVTRQHGAIAVVIAEPESKVFADPFFTPELRGISKELSAAQLQLVLLLVETSREYQRVGAYLAGDHVDGALVFSVHERDPLPALVREAGLPSVFGGRPWEPEPDDLYVDTDNRAGAQAAVRHLIGAGRRRIAHITGPMDLTASLDRLDGYHDVLPDADPRLVEESDFTADGGERAMAALLDRVPDLDGVFAASDLTASGALRALRARGRRVPEDVSLVGFDDVGLAAVADPPLTTVRQDIEGMGRSMARMLVRLLEYDGDVAAAELIPVIHPAILVPRRSA